MVEERAERKQEREELGDGNGGERERKQMCGVAKGMNEEDAVIL